MPGPGGRRGCNRLKSRNLTHYVTFGWGAEQAARAEAAVKDFQREIRELWKLRGNLWPTASRANDFRIARADMDELFAQNLSADMDCSDIQFQLCEFDKFQRALEASSG